MTLKDLVFADILEIFPLDVGKSAEFVRRRADGSATWRHRIRVTDSVQVATSLGEVNVFVIETAIEGVEGNNFRGNTVSYWSPDLALTVYELNTGGNSRSELSLADYKRP